MAIIILDDDFCIDGVNEFVEELFGCSSESIYGQSITQFIPDFDVTKYKQSQFSDLNKKLDLKAQNIEGHIFGLEYQVKVVNNPKARSYVVIVNRVQTISSDIKEQSYINESQNHQWLSYLLRASPVVIYSCVPNGSFPTTFISENIERLTGFSPSDYLATPDFWIQHVHPDDKNDLFTRMDNLFGTTKSLSFEYRFLCADGRYIWVLDKLKISRNTEGEPTELLGLWLDITDRKNNEEALKKANLDLKQKSDQLTDSNVELSQFTYVVSHDLKAPLRAVHSYCDWLSEDLDGKLESDQQEYITGMQEAVQQAENLIEDLLELSRVGRRSAEPEEILLSVFFEELASNVVHDKTVSVSIQSDMPCVEVSPTILKQVFQNIVTNAHTYNESELKTIDISGKLEGERYTISIADNGIGIDERFHERVFQLFQRLHTKEEYDGTGIGLAIVQKAIMHLNWQLDLESSLNKGSTFLISFPIDEIKKHD